MRWLRENWLWIAVPFALVALAAWALVAMGDGAFSGAGGYEVR